MLLVDDEPDMGLAAGDALRDAGHRVVVSTNGAEALELVTTQPFDVMICDIRLPKLDGLTLFRRTRQESPDTAVILMTAFGAVAGRRRRRQGGGARLPDQTLRHRRDHAARPAHRRAPDACCASWTTRARSSPTSRRGRPSSGRSVQMLRLLDRVNTIATSHAPVLLQGESGTGKELVARALHDRGTAARKGVRGRQLRAPSPTRCWRPSSSGTSAAPSPAPSSVATVASGPPHGGTLLLDEVAEMSLAAQAKLLRVLQEGTIEPLGTNESVRVDVRVISATHRNLRERIADRAVPRGSLLPLNVLNVDIPPLRDRKGDLPLLVQYYLKKLSKPEAPVPRVTPAAWAVLSEFPFPGNVRQLGHAIEHAMVLAAGGDIDVQHLPRDIAHIEVGRGTATLVPRPLGTAMKEFEREYLQRALTQADGKRTLAAEILGISRKNLWEKLRMHGMGDGD